MTGIHDHPELTELNARIEALTARVAALEALGVQPTAPRDPAHPLPLGFGAGFRLPPDLPQAVVRDAASLRDALRGGNIEVEIPEGLRLEYRNTPEVGPNVRLHSPGRGAMLKAAGRNACLALRGDNILVQNLAVEGGEDESHGKQVQVGPVDHYWLDHVTFQGAADEGLELWAWPTAADAAGDGLISYCHFSNRGGFSKVKGMIIGGKEQDGRCAARTRVTVYRSLFDVYQRGPLVGDGAYVHLLECAWSGWGIYAVKTRRGGVALVENCHFRYSGGDHPDKTLSGWGEPDHAVRAKKVTTSGGALLREVRPELVPDPPYAYTAAEKEYDWIVAHAGAGVRAEA